MKKPDTLAKAKTHGKRSSRNALDADDRRQRASILSDGGFTPYGLNHRSSTHQPSERPIPTITVEFVSDEGLSQPERNLSDYAEFFAPSIEPEISARPKSIPATSKPPLKSPSAVQLPNAGGISKPTPGKDVPAVETKRRGASQRSETRSNSSSQESLATSRTSLSSRDDGLGERRFHPQSANRSRSSAATVERALDPSAVSGNSVDNDDLVALERKAGDYEDPNKGNAFIKGEVYEHMCRWPFHSFVAAHRRIFPYLNALDDFLQSGRSSFRQKISDAKPKYDESKIIFEKIRPEEYAQNEFDATRSAELSLEHFLESSPSRARIRYFTDETEIPPPETLPKSIYELYGVLQQCQYKRSNTARLILVEDIDPFHAELLGHFLHLDLDFLNDHIRKVNQNASVELPSYSEPRSHLLVPFRRLCSQHDADFSQETFHSREEHASIAFCPEDGWKWTCVVLYQSLPDSTPLSAKNASFRKTPSMSMFEVPRRYDPEIALRLSDKRTKFLSDKPFAANPITKPADIFESFLERKTMTEASIRLVRPHTIGAELVYQLEKGQFEISHPRVYDDPTHLLSCIFKIALSEWTWTLDKQETFLKEQSAKQYSSIKKFELQDREKFAQYLLSNANMIDKVSTVIKSHKLVPGFRRPRFQDEIGVLLKDLRYLATKNRAQIRQNEKGMQFVTSMMAVEESRNSIKQAEDVKKLTMLATIYIPLTFVAGVFGMNVQQFNLSQHNITIWEYWIVAIPVTVLSVFSVIFWDILTTRIWKLWTWPWPQAVQKFLYPKTAGLYASARTIARSVQRSRDLRRQQVAEAVGLPMSVERGTSTILVAGMGMGLAATGAQYVEREDRDDFISDAYYGHDDASVKRPLPSAFTMRRWSSKNTPGEEITLHTISE